MHLCNSDKDTAPTSKFSALLASSPGWSLVTTFLKKECRRVQQVHHFGMEERLLTLSEIKYLWRLVQIWKVLKQVEYRCRVGSAQYNSMTFQEKEKETNNNDNNNINNYSSNNNNNNNNDYNINNNAQTDNTERQTSNLTDHPAAPNATTNAANSDGNVVAITNDLNLLTLSLQDDQEQEKEKEQEHKEAASSSYLTKKPKELYIEKIFSVDEVSRLILFFIHIVCIVYTYSI
jgi:hypothetical protein